MKNITVYSSVNITEILQYVGKNNICTYLFSHSMNLFAHLVDPILKVRQFQNEFMKSSFLPKYERKIVKISALTTQGRNPDNFLFVFWEKG